MIQRRIRRHMDERHYRATCTFRWSTLRRSRELRERDTYEHQAEWTSCLTRDTEAMSETPDRAFEREMKAWVLLEKLIAPAHH
jgi:hypothetical protein